MLRDRMFQQASDSQSVFPLACGAEIHWVRRSPVCERNIAARLLGYVVYLSGALGVFSQPLNFSACRCLARRAGRFHSEIELEEIIQRGNYRSLAQSIDTNANKVEVCRRDRVQCGSMKN